MKIARAVEYCRYGHVNFPVCRCGSRVLDLSFDSTQAIVVAEMGTRSNSTAFQAASVLNFAACLVSVLMLLAFPMQSAFRLADHFRAPEVRRSIVRHTFIAQHQSGPVDRIARQAVLPAFPAPIDTENVTEPISNIEISSQVPLSRLLLRVKLGPSRSGGRDPLL